MLIAVVALGLTDNWVFYIFSLKLSFPTVALGFCPLSISVLLY